MSMSIDLARRILEASKQRARELRSPVSIAIVDAGGHLVLFERMMAPYGWATGDISIAKAATAVMFNQSTDAVAQWGAGIPGFASSMASMTEGKFIMASGGWPVRIGGATIGGIGVSGGNAPGRDDEIAQAGLSAVDAVASAAPAPSGQASSPAHVKVPPVSPASSVYSSPTSSTPPANRMVSQHEFPDLPPTTQHLPSEQNNSYGEDSFSQFNSNKDRQGGF